MSIIIHNSSFKDKSDYHSLNSFIDHLVENNSSEKYIIVLPTGKLVRKFQNQYIRKFYSKFSIPTEIPKVYTLDGFANLCFSKLFETHKYRLLTDTYRVLLIEEAINSIELEFFKYKNKSLSFPLIERIANLIFGLKEDGILPENLKTDIGAPSKNNVTNIKKLKDIYYIYLKYQELLETKLLDKTELLNKLNTKLDTMTQNTNGELFDNKEIKLFDRDIKIILSGFSEFKIPEAHFLSQFYNMPNPFAIYFDYSEHNGPLFGKYIDILNVFNSKGFDIKNIFDDIEKVLFQVEDNLALKPTLFLRRQLFNVTAQIKHTGFSDMVSIIAASHKYDEVVSIAKLIKYLNTEKNIPFGKMCIVMRNPADYSRLIRETFYKYSIPANVSDRYVLSESLVSGAITSLLNVVANNFKFKDVFKALRNPYIEFSYLENNKRKEIDADNLIQTARKLRIAALSYQNKETWKKFIQNAINRVSILNKDPNNFTDEYERDEYKKTQSSYEKAYSDFNIFCSFFPEDINNESLLSPNEFANIIKTNFIKKFNIAGKISDAFKQLINNTGTNHSDFEYEMFVEQLEREGRALNAFIDTINEITFILENRYPNNKYTFQELYKRLYTASNVSKFNLREKTGHGVTITAIEQIRGMDYDVSILCGAIDGKFPLSYRVETMLGKEPENSEMFHLQSEYMLFYQFLTNTPEKVDTKDKLIYITYPKKENSEDLVPSHFIDELLKITTLKKDNKIFDLNEFRNQAQQNTFDNELQWLDAPASFSELSEFVATLRKTSNDIPEELNNIYENLNDNYFNRKYLLEYNKQKNNSQNFEINELPEKLKELFNNIPDEVFSVSQLDTYTDCPYKYYAKYILKLSEQELPDLMLEPLEKGIFLHNTMYKFYTELKETQIKNNPDNFDSNLVKLVREENHYVKKIENIAENAIKHYLYEHPFFNLEKKQLIGDEHNDGFLKIFIRNDYERIHINGFNPAFFELSFGIGNYNNINNFPVEKIKTKSGNTFSVKGKIDRIELKKIGENKYSLIVADYKTTKNSFPSNKDILEQRKLQIPIYLYVARQILQNNFNLEIIFENGVYYSFKPFEEGTNQVYMDNMFTVYNPDKYTQEDIEEHIEDALETSYKTINKIASGKFKYTPNPKICQRCDFYYLCRYKEIK